MKKLLNHIVALEAKALGVKYGKYNDTGTKHKAHRVLCVYEKESVMKSVMKKLLATDSAWTEGKWFLFKTMKEVVPDISSDFEITNEKDFYEGWHCLDGSICNFLD